MIKLDYDPCIWRVLCKSRRGDRNYGIGHDPARSPDVVVYKFVAAAFLAKYDRGQVHVATFYALVDKYVACTRTVDKLLFLGHFYTL